MRSTESPKAARWLLSHFGWGPNNDAVIGDLDERYGQHASHIWYWRQAIISVIAGFITEVRLHKLVVLRGLLIGTAFQVLSLYAILLVVIRTSHQQIWEHPNVLLLAVFTAVVTCALDARLVGWLHRPHERTVVFAFVIAQFLAVLVPVRGVAIPVSWIFVISGSLNVLLWNTYGMTALNRACDICTSPSGYRVFQLVTSTVVTGVSLLVGSGVLSSRAHRSSTRSTPA